MSNKNSNGGVHVDREEVKQAFLFFDNARNGFITLQDLRTTLSVIDKSLGLNDLKFLMNHKKQLSEEDIYKMLANNTLKNFDPAKEAFKIFADSKNKNRMDVEKLKKVLVNLGLEEDVSDHDIEIIKDMVGSKRDGDETYLAYENFRNMLQVNPPLNSHQ
mmetsp:Transcript_15557/g.27916  ORF Transcript_15557/g.27916 Transcript_15557/m.27916 type:complete len:160 (+) Transcript_15557:57-536(+)|eukprot:CAMPEP_0197519978 /NCGR_PEP_ID=MMETSP1318-20131121/5243_1 /TAXON_ID=552666 /ORGANISM="Partenskyella glossopodia, Strain RCC365" /LENGTH=159 /DNA_ID=CAMNT_0043071269 /DNA_START=64 /DNA_END=543 /DNA_ORIENTATION=-